ncbi:MAG: TPM domain-containing protein [Synechococcales cyanobacterium C42_A2020_086]|nr:TPM domain-containing protein [Synechococcales cyanobacterium C42_A2020_086]
MHKMVNPSPSWKWTRNQNWPRQLLAGLAGLILMLQLWMLGVEPASATGVYSMPSLAPGEPTWVVDQAGALSRATRGELGGNLEKLAKQTGTEVRFVTIHRLDYGETIDSFTDKLFETWYPTPEAQANQVLLVLDNVTNTAAIRVGSGVESVLPKETAESVAQETLLVPLRQGNKYNQAFLDASDRLVAVLSGEPDPGPPVVESDVQIEGTFARAEDTNDRSATILVVVLLVLATVIPMATYYLYQAFQS